ncbi:hypothetical protein GYH30_049284 [Glycine max]|nr:hypothetical protein GYH30_049284 [Glycine max]
MWESEAEAKAAGSETRDEVVVDNSNTVESLDTRKVVVLGKAPSATISANDQKVPALQDSKTEPPTRKRPKTTVEEGKNQDNSQNHNKEDTGMSSIDQDICSTADSSSCKKQCASTSSFIFSSTAVFLIYSSEVAMARSD